MQKKLTRQMGEANLTGFMGETKRSMLSWELRFAKSMSEATLENMLFGKPAGVSMFAKLRRGLTALRNLRILSTAAVTAGGGDAMLSSMHLKKIIGDGGEGVPEVWKGWATVLKDRVGRGASRVRRDKWQHNLEMAKRMHLLTNAAMADWQARTGESKGTGLFSYLENKMMNMTGLPLVTDIGRSSNAMIMAMGMGEAISMPYRSLAPSFVAELNHHGIGQWEWDFVRGLRSLEMGGGGSLVPVGLASFEDGTGGGSGGFGAGKGAGDISEV